MDQRDPPAACSAIVSGDGFWHIFFFSLGAVVGVSLARLSASLAWGLGVSLELARLPPRLIEMLPRAGRMFIESAYSSLPMGREEKHLEGVSGCNLSKRTVFCQAAREILNLCAMYQLGAMEICAGSSHLRP